MSLSPATAAVTTWIHTAVASGVVPAAFTPLAQGGLARATKRLSSRHLLPGPIGPSARQDADCGFRTVAADGVAKFSRHRHALMRSEEHTSELQSLMRISYAVFCLKKKNQRTKTIRQINYT